MDRLAGERHQLAEIVADALNIVAHGRKSTEEFQNYATGVYVACQMCLLLFDLRFVVILGHARPSQCLVMRRAWQAINAINIRENYPALIAFVDRSDE